MVAQEFNGVAPFTTRPAPICPSSDILFRPDMEAVISAAPWTCTLPFSALRAGNFSKPNMFLCKFKYVHQTLPVFFLLSFFYIYLFSLQ
jgi:hypothetical protein